MPARGSIATHVNAFERDSATMNADNTRPLSLPRRTAIVAALLAAAFIAIGAMSGAALACESAALTDASTDEVQTDHAEGVLRAVASSVRSEPGRPAAAPSVSLAIDTDDGLLFVTIVDGALVADAGGEPTDPGAIPLGARLRVEGRRLSPTTFEATAVSVLP